MDSMAMTARHAGAGCDVAFAKAIDDVAVGDTVVAVAADGTRTHRQVVATITGHGPNIQVDVVHGSARAMEFCRAVSLSLGFGGHNACLVLDLPAG
jgi:hypothetical protein